MVINLFTIILILMNAMLLWSYSTLEVMSLGCMEIAAYFQVIAYAVNYLFVLLFIERFPVGRQV